MSKAVMISIQPKWCELICSGKKTVEVRKTKPKLETPFKCYIYCTYGRVWLTSVNGKVQKPNNIVLDLTKDSEVQELNGKVIGEFVCDAIFPISIFYSNPKDRLASREFPFTCLTDKEIMDYLGNGVEGYGWHISDLVIYDKPKELSEFKQIKIIRGYHKEGETKIEKLLKGSRIEVKYLTRPPQSWCYVEESK